MKWLAAVIGALFIVMVLFPAVNSAAAATRRG
jgi:hypothetical protein